ncbi:HAD family hydrolase [Streptomyces himalayensis]|uniref:HAD-IA family hydrolase n=1 Tax=Streptomyces himalayensis subsp. himalayensis TaxID=2756131 RepID=A0A7W0DV76_9ACTN|nr:HAD-IA family hydrolase [Streptomyces himalayensis]MBA2951923.1 HAD-IA family hydrolase [Streptomyces himalayensis subsp. himalayensis]
MTISAVLFDVDGVLLDSTAAHRRIWTSWSLARGLNPEKVWRLTFGRRPEDTVKDAAPHLDPVIERRVLDELLAQEKDGFPPLDGAADLLEALSDSPWAIVTSGDRTSVGERFAAAGLPLPAVQVYGSDVEHAKPAPDCFALAASRLGVAPSACLVVEDAPAGVSAAVAAGCTVIGLTTTHREESLGQAHMCAASLAEVRNLLIAQGFLARP